METDSRSFIREMAPQAGFEPATLRLTAFAAPSAPSLGPETYDLLTMVSGEPLISSLPGTIRGNKGRFYWVIRGWGATPAHPNPRTIVPNLSPRAVDPIPVSAARDLVQGTLVTRSCSNLSHTEVTMSDDPRWSDDTRDREPEPRVDRSHPLGVPARQVVVERQDMHTLAGQGS
jgi:hypothetical protein